MEQYPPSPRIAALLEYIERTLSETPASSSAAGAAADDRVLFMGSWQSTIPRLILHDTVLSAEAKVLWGLLKDSASPSTAGIIPSQEKLCREIPISSRTTLRVVIAELRATRLLTVYPRPRTQLGRITGHLYLLHDEQLTLSDALCLDPDYLLFLRQTRHHGHRRVRLLADAILNTLNIQIDQAIDVLAPSTLEHRAARHEAQQIMEARDTPLSQAVPDDNPFFPAGRAGIAAMTIQNPAIVHHGQKLTMDNSYKEPVSIYKNHHDQNLTMDQNLTHGQKLTMEESHSSSSYFNNNKTTTTTPTPPLVTVPVAVANETASLVWPATLSQAERELCMTLLETVSAQWWQNILDELEGRIRWGNTQGDPLRNKVRWLKALCDDTRKSGLFTPALGETVRAERTKKAANPTPPAAAPSPPKPIDKDLAKAGMAKLLKVLGR